MTSEIENVEYTTDLSPGSHWSLRVRRGTLLRITTSDTNSNMAMLLYNPENLLERYNAPDTLKCQHTFKLTAGHCLYSDMGRIFASIIEDNFGWHETMMGNCTADHVAANWGTRSYQRDRNNWLQNGHDAFLVELSKYGLGRADMAANINWFSKVVVNQVGKIALDSHSQIVNASVTLRFEIDTLVIMHSCPHPLNTSTEYPSAALKIDLARAQPVAEDDMCKNLCAENKRGFQNNYLYNFM